jgi:hypothetical protein
MIPEQFEGFGTASTVEFGVGRGRRKCIATVKRALLGDAIFGAKWRIWIEFGTSAFAIMKDNQ